MNVQTRRRYSAEFKAQAVELANAGKPVLELAQDLGIGSDLIYCWVRQSRSAQLGSTGAGAAGDRSEADELRTLRRQVARLQMENDILKKAAVILGTQLPKSDK